MEPTDSAGSSPYPYATHLNVLFGALEKIELDPLVSAVRDQWYNQTLARVNDSVVRLGVMQGEYHWHQHDDDDEFFYVVSGRLFVDIEGGPSVELLPEQGYVVPKGVVHRTRAPERAAMLMIATAAVKPTGD